MATPKQKERKKRRWCVTAEITENTIFMMGPPITFFVRQWPKRGLGGFIREYFTYYKGDFSQMWYHRDEFDAAADFLAKKMISNPRWALALINKVERWSNRFMSAAVSFKKLPFRRMSNRELVRAFQRVLHWHTLSHGVGSAVSWHADADKERVTRAIIASLRKNIDRLNQPEPAAVVFSTLSTPHEDSFTAREEMALLKLADKLLIRRKTRQLIKRTTARDLEKALLKADPAAAKALIKHFSQWSWLPYAYKGPAYPLTHFIARLRKLAAANKAPARVIVEIKQENKEFYQQQKKLEKSLRLTAYQRRLIELSRRMVFLKDYRKGSLYHGMYCYEPFFREVGRRLGLTLNQVWALNSWEIVNWLECGRSIPKKELDARQVEAVAYVTPTRYVVWTGRKAKQFFGRIPKEQPVPAGKVNELRGTCASPGLASGIVKIVDVPIDMKKMRQGDILVSETTYPSLVPAMKKAAAIVTNAGGLTCHAAIVSRELGIPCVVGTKIANKVLNDGDRVEVDATKGIVKKLP